MDEPSQLGLGVKGLFFVEEGFRNFFTKEEVTDISGMNGLKIRVSTDPILTGVVEQLGASPTVISFTELYSSLQTGVVDGADQPTALYESNAFNEVAPYLIEDEHTMSASEVIITRRPGTASVQISRMRFWRRESRPVSTARSFPDR